MRIILRNFAMLKFLDYEKECYHVCVDVGFNGHVMRKDG